MNSNESAESYFDFITRVKNKLLQELDPSMDTSSTDEVRRTVTELFERVLADESVNLSRTERARLFEQIVAEILGFGPLQPLLEDPTITAIMVNGPKYIYIERKGKIFRIPAALHNNDHAMRIIDRIVDPWGRRIDESQPIQSARMPDGGRGTFVIPFPSLVGPIIYLKKPTSRNQGIFYSGLRKEGEFFQQFSDNARIRTLLTHILHDKQNLIIVSEPGVGKSSFISQLLRMRAGTGLAFRIQNTIEDENYVESIVDLEAILPNVDGKGGVSCTELWLAATRMGPNLIVCEIQEDDNPLTVLNSLLSLNTWTSISGRTPTQGLENFVSLIHDYIPLISLSEIRFCLSNSLDYVIHIAASNGKRWISSIDRLGLDNATGEFSLIPQFHLGDIEATSVSVEKLRKDSTFRRFLKGFRHTLSSPKALDQLAGRLAGSGEINTKENKHTEKTTEPIDSVLNLDALFQNPYIHDVLAIDQNIFSVQSNQLEIVGKLKDNVLLNFVEQVSGSKYDAMPAYVSLPSKHPAISRIETAASNTYFCRAMENLPALNHLLSGFSMEMQSQITELIRKGASIAVTGLPGSGRTTLVNSIANEIPQTKHIVALESTPELRLNPKGPNTQLIQTSQTETDDVRGQINAKVILDLCPDNLIVDGDYLLPLDELEQCLRTVPVIITLTGKSASHAVEALSLKLCKSLGIPLLTARMIVANTFDLILHVERTNDGSVKISEIIMTQSNGNLEKIRNSSFYEAAVTFPTGSNSSDKISNAVISSAFQHSTEIDAQVSPAAQQNSEEKNLLELLEIGSEIHSRQKWAPLADAELENTAKNQITTDLDYELDQLVDVLSFASKLPKKLFGFFANPSANYLLIKCDIESLFWVRGSTGTYERGFLTPDEKKVLMNQFNLALNSKKSAKGLGLTISSVQFVPWLEFCMIRHPTVDAETIYVIRKRPRIPLMLSTLRTYYEIDSSLMEELKNGITNQLNILIIGNSYAMPELVVEGLANSAEEYLPVGIVTQFGRILTASEPGFSIDLDDFHQLGLGRSAQLISEEINASGISLLALTVYPATLRATVDRSRGLRIIAGTCLHPTVQLRPPSSDYPHTSDREFDKYLAANFDLIYRISIPPSGIPKIIRF